MQHNHIFLKLYSTWTYLTRNSKDGFEYVDDKLEETSVCASVVGVHPWKALGLTDFKNQT